MKVILKIISLISLLLSFIAINTGEIVLVSPNSNDIWLKPDSVKWLGNNKEVLRYDNKLFSKSFSEANYYDLMNQVKGLDTPNDPSDDRFTMAKSGWIDPYGYFDIDFNRDTSHIKKLPNNLLKVDNKLYNLLGVPLNQVMGEATYDTADDLFRGADPFESYDIDGKRYENIEEFINSLNQNIANKNAALLGLATIISGYALKKLYDWYRNQPQETSEHETAKEK